MYVALTGVSDERSGVGKCREPVGIIVGITENFYWHGVFALGGIQMKYTQINNKELF